MKIAENPCVLTAPGWLVGFGAIVVFALATVPVSAQGPGEGGPPPGPPGGFRGGPAGMRFPMMAFDPHHSSALQLLNRPDVQQELGLSADQRAQITSILRQGMQDMRQQMMEWMQQNPPPSQQDFQNMSAEERQAFFQKRMHAMEELRSKIEDAQMQKVYGVLNPQQQTRLSQLDLQWRTALTLVDDKVANQLNLTPDQKDQIKQIVDQFLQSHRGFGPGFARRGGPNNGPQPGGPPQPPGDQGAGGPPGQPGGPNGRRPRGGFAGGAFLQQQYQERQDAAKKVLALLTPDQQAQWQQMIGKPFHFDFGGPGGPPPPPNMP